MGTTVLLIVKEEDVVMPNGKMSIGTTVKEKLVNVLCINAEEIYKELFTVPVRVCV